MQFPDTSVIGTGGLGTGLTQTLIARNIVVRSIFNRTSEKARNLAAETGINIWGNFPTSLEQLGHLIFITVADRAIEDVAIQLSQLKGDFSKRIFVHCSGNLSADKLTRLKAEGATVASFHPLQTFTLHSGPKDFRGIYFSIQGDTKAYPILQSIAKQFGAKTIEVTKEQKSFLHAAAVFSSNYLNTLLNQSVEVGSLGGLSASKVKKALLPLAKTTLQNVHDQSFEDALTGPIKRGDIETVKKHLALLDGRDDLRKLYSILGLHTVKLAELSGTLDGLTVEKLRKILR